MLRSDLEVQDDLTAGGLGATVAVLDLGGFGAHLVQGGDAGGDEDVAANDCPLPDDGVSAEDGCPGVDRHVVFDGGMALLPAQELAEGGGERAQGYALVELDVFADFGGF